MDLEKIDFLRTPAPPGLKVTIDNLGGFTMKIDEAPGGSLAEAIATVYVMKTGRAVLNCQAFAARLKATRLDVQKREISVIVP
jgi:hypothetical protein